MTSFRSLMVGALNPLKARRKTSHRFILQLEPLDERINPTARASYTIAGSGDGDNIALYNPSGSEHPYQQRLTSILVNTSTDRLKDGMRFKLTATSQGGGAVKLSYGGGAQAATVTTEVLPVGGQCKPVSIFPTSVSKKPLDVTIDVYALPKGGSPVKVATQKMTVVTCDFTDEVTGQFTPTAMKSAGVYRIPPKVDTEIKFTLEPNLKGSPHDLSFRISQQSDDHGTATINGEQTHIVTSPGTLDLRGVDQTQPKTEPKYGTVPKYKDLGPVFVKNDGAITTANPNAGRLQLELLVSNTRTIHSSGFSVTAVPKSIAMTGASEATGDAFGFNADMAVTSDSGSIADLDMVAIGEKIHDVGTGFYSGGTKDDSSKYYVGPASSHAYHDSHSTAIKLIRDSNAVEGKIKTDQLYAFIDARTGFGPVAIKNSGFLVTKEFTVDSGLVLSNVTKRPRNVDVNGFHADAGGGTGIANFPQQKKLNPGIFRASPSIDSPVPIVPAQASKPQLSVRPTYVETPSIAVAKDTPQFAVSSGFNFTDISFEQTGQAFSVTGEVYQFGSLLTSYNGPVTLSMAYPASAMLSGTLTVNAVNGIATFTGLTVTNPIPDFYLQLQASVDGVGSNTSDYFYVKAGQIQIHPVMVVSPPHAVETHQPFGLTIRVEKGTGHIETSFNGTVNVNIPYGYQNALVGTTTIPVVNGIAEFTNLQVLHTGNAYLGVLIEGTNLNYVLTDAYLTATTTASVLAFETSPPTGLTANAGFGFSVEARNPYGDRDVTFQGNVTISFANNPASATLGGTVTVKAVDGVATFSGIKINQPGMGYTLKASAAGLTDAISDPLTVTVAGVPVKLAITLPPPGTTSTGKPISLRVAAQDGFGKVNTSYNGPVTIRLQDFAGSPGELAGTVTVNAIKGVATFTNLVITDPGQVQLVASSAGLADATSKLFTVNAVAARLTVSAPLTDPLTANRFTVIVRAEDAFGNLIHNYNGTISVALADKTSGTLTGFLSGKTYDGQVYFSSLKISNPTGSVAIKATAPGLVAGFSPRFDVTDDALAVTVQPPTTLTTGTGFGFTVNALNAAGTIDTGYNGLLTVSDINGTPLTGTSTVQAVNGVANFTGLSFETVGSYFALRVTGNGIHSVTTDPLEVSATASRVVIDTPPPVAVTAGSPFGLTVRIEDNFGNFVSDYNGPVNLAIGTNPAASNLGGILTVNAVNGLAHFSNLSINNPASGYTLTASVNGLTSGETASFNVLAAGQATQLVVTGLPPTSATSGIGISLSISAKDDSGTVDSSFTGSVTLSDDAGIPLATLHAVNGVANFTGVNLPSIGSITLSASANGLASVQTDPITVTNGLATHLLTFGPHGSLFTGASFDTAVYAVDVNGNFDPTFTGQVTLALVGSGGTLNGTLAVNAEAGVAQFTNLNVTGIGVGYSLWASSNGLTAGTSAKFDVISRQLLVTSQIGPVAPGGSFGFNVSAVNAAGKLDATFTGPVTVSLTGAGATLGGTVTVNAVKGVASFKGVSINNPGVYSLAVSGVGLGSTITNSFLVQSAPTPLGPTGNINNLQPTLSWSAVPVADHYELTLTDKTTNRTIKLPPATGTAYTLTNGSKLTVGHNYSWTISAISADGLTTLTSSQSFAVTA